MNNRLEEEILNYLATNTLEDAMKNFSGLEVYEVTRPYDRLTGFNIKKGTLHSIEFSQWRGKEVKLRIGLQNIKENSSTSNNTEFDQYFWTLDEAFAQCREYFEAERPQPEELTNGGD